LRAQVAAQEEAIAAAARIFLDAQRSVAEREQAVAAVPAFLRPDQVAAAFALARNPGVPPRLRAIAVLRTASALANDTGFISLVISLVDARPTAPELRRAALSVLEDFTSGMMVRHVRHDDFVAVLRRLARDPDQAIRTRAIAIAAAHADAEIQGLLLQGLRSPAQALVSRTDAIRFLALAPNDSVYPVVQAVLGAEQDPGVRTEAVRLLGAYVPSRPLLARILANPGEPVAIRLAAMGALHAGDPQSFPEVVRPIVEDETASDTLRTFGIQAVQLRRRAAHADTVALGGDSFDRAMIRLARESRSAVVRRAAESYIRSRGLRP